MYISEIFIKEAFKPIKIKMSKGGIPLYAGPVKNANVELAKKLAKYGLIGGSVASGPLALNAMMKKAVDNRKELGDESAMDVAKEKSMFDVESPITGALVLRKKKRNNE